MIEYFTMLSLTYVLMDTEHKTNVLYDKYIYCQEAMDNGLLYDLYNQLYEKYGNNISMQCIETDIISHKIKPRVRPW